MSEDQTQTGEGTRRNWLKMVAGGSITLLAGCSSNGDGGSGAGTTGGSGAGTTGGSDNGTEVVDQTFALGAVGNTGEMNFNIAAVQNAVPPELLGTLMWDRLATFRAFEGDHRNDIATEWSINESTITVNLNENYVWEDSENLTADDVILNLRLLEIQNETLWEFAESISASGDYTVEVMLGDVNPNLAVTPLVNNFIWAKGGPYEGFVESYQDASSDDQRNTVRQNLFQHRDKAPIANGPFSMSNIDSNRILLERREDYPKSSNVNFTEVEGRASENASSAYRAAAANQIDAVAGSNLSLRSRVDNNWQFSIRPATGGHGLFFNFNEAPYNNRNVRKAIAHVVNTEKFTDLLGSGAGTIQVPIVNDGLTNTVTNNWLSDDFISQLEDYSGSNPDRAAELLQMEGYENNNGNWVKDGQPLQAPFKYPASWASGITAWQGIVEDLNDFGLSAEGIGLEASTYIGSTLPQSDFLLADQTVGSAQPHPFFHYQAGILILRNTMNLIPSDDWVVKVPNPIGDPEGNLEEVNVTQQYQKLRTPVSEEEQQSIVEKLAWTFNQYVPYQQTSSDRRNQPLNTQNFNIGVSYSENNDRIIRPDEGNPNLHIFLPSSEGIKTGVVRAKSN